MTENPEERRYGEPKKIGDIINDMGLGHKDQQGKKFADKLVRHLTAYNKRMEVMDSFYQRASRLITKMDDFFLQEKKRQSEYKQLAAKQRLTKKDVFERMQSMEDTNNYFEHIQQDIRKYMRSVSDSFDSHDDRKEHKEKIDAFCSLFTQIYTDIDDIYYVYSLMIARLP